MLNRNERTMEKFACVVFFDGMCGFCNGSVNFLIRQDGRRRLRYAPQQGEAYGELKREHPGLEGMDSVVVVERTADGGPGRIFVRSAASLRAMEELPGLWPMLARLGRMIPERLRDALYNLVARNRYRWFGRLEACRMPGPGERELFVDAPFARRDKEVAPEGNGR